MGLVARVFYYGLRWLWFLMKGMKEEERGRKMDRESNDFKERGEERGERVMVSFLFFG